MKYYVKTLVAIAILAVIFTLSAVIFLIVLPDSDAEDKNNESTHTTVSTTQDITEEADNTTAADVEASTQTSLTTEQQDKIILTGEDIVDMAADIGSEMSISDIKYAHSDEEKLLRQMNLADLENQGEGERYAICSDYLSYVLQQLGVLSKKYSLSVDNRGRVRCFYSSDNECTYAKPNDPQTQIVKAQLSVNFNCIHDYDEYTMVTMPDTALCQGDIVCFKEHDGGSIHMMIYDSGSGEDMLWYNGGSATENDETGYIEPTTEATAFSRYKNWQVTCVIRSKDE